MNANIDNNNFYSDQLLNDNNSIYYKFENGLIIKYDKDRSLFYRLDGNNNWIFDNSVLSLLTDSKFEYTVIKETGGKTK